MKTYPGIRLNCSYLATHPKWKVVNIERQLHHHFLREALRSPQFHKTASRTEIYDYGRAGIFTRPDLDGRRTYTPKTGGTSLLFQDSTRTFGWTTLDELLKQSLKLSS